MIRPRLTDHFGIQRPQTQLDFAIPLLDQDIPLYVDPFLLWKSPSFQDNSLHGALLNGFNHLGYLAANGKHDEALQRLIASSECDEVGLGVSSRRKGKRIGSKQAANILQLFGKIPRYSHGFQHFEEIQLFVDGISKDRISDITCSFIKSFLIDFTIDQCEALRVPLKDVAMTNVYDPSSYQFRSVDVKLPINPISNTPILLIPKRWLRFTPWLNFDDYFKDHCPKDPFGAPDGSERVKVLAFNRDNYGVVADYVQIRERMAADCTNDPLFKQIPITSAKWHLKDLLKLPAGNKDNVDKKYEEHVSQLLASLMYPELDFADIQSRTEDGVQIRDLIFYNTDGDPFLEELGSSYGTRQIPMELKNVANIEREHITQLNRYMTDDFGRFGVLVTRNELRSAMRKNVIALWSGQRRCIVTLTDSDLSQMVELFGTKQRKPLDVLKKKYVEFRRSCPA